MRDYHINADIFERAYKDHLSGFRTWPELAHADKWLVFPCNVGPHSSIDETCVSRGETYTIVTNKDAHGLKGCLVAIVKGVKAKDVIRALKNIPEPQRTAVKEITLDFSDSMRGIAGTCFPCAMITLDRFHHQRFCLEAMQEVRREYRREQMTRDAIAREEHKIVMRGCRRKARLLMRTAILSVVMPGIIQRGWRTAKHAPSFSLVARDY